MLPYAANRGVNGQGALGNSIMSCWGHSVQSAVPTLVKVILTADFVVKRCQQEFVLVSPQYSSLIYNTFKVHPELKK